MTVVLEMPNNEEQIAKMKSRASAIAKEQDERGAKPTNFRELKPGHEFDMWDKIMAKTPAKLKELPSFWTRLIFGAMYLFLVIGCFALGNVATMIILSVIAFISSQEFYYMLRKESRLPNEMIGSIGAIAYVPAMNYFGLKGCAAVTLLLLLVLLVWYVFWMKAKVSDVGVSLFGSVYTGGFLSGFMYISANIAEPYSNIALIIIFLSCCANDSFAYLIGRAFGKHKLAPRTSPNKSWEGFWAGMVACVIFWLIFVFVPWVHFDVFQAIVFGIISCLCQVLGDLAESRIKRNSGFKDSGWILPGHGGLLDRCDSLFLASVSAVIIFIISGVIPLG